MSKLSKELLISKGVKFVFEGNEVYFSIASLKKKFHGLEIKKSDIYLKEIDGKSLQCVTIENIIGGETTHANIISADGRAAELEVKDPEFVDCDKDCNKKQCDEKSCKKK